MTAVITHARRTSRLSKLIDAAGGVTIGTALAQAKANMAALAPRSLEEVAARIAELAAIPSPEDASADAGARLAQVYHAANGVIDAAGPFDEDVRVVAAGLCDLIDDASPERPFDWRVLPVYAQSLQLLISLPGDQTEARAKVRESLDRMVDKKLSQTG
jgi:hypothetical protein